MNKIHPEDSANPEPVLKQHLRHEIDLGIAMAADPDNANLPDLTIRTTTINSPWYTRTCKVCQDKFREGDQVRLCPECGEPYHDDSQYDLHCWQKHFASGNICTEGGTDRFSELGREVPVCDYTWDGRLPSQPAVKGTADQGDLPHKPPATPVIAQFVSGLETVWRPYGEQRSFKVQPHSSLVGRNCPWCRFRIRAGDWIVECPCESNCGTYFHQDVFRHLTCWNEWNGVEGNNYCPNTGAPYAEPGDSQGERGDER